MSDKRSQTSAVAHIDGASKGNPGPSAIGVVITTPGGEAVSKIKQFIGTATNNQAEYRALITAIRAAVSLGKTDLHVKTDSLLLASQMNGEWKVKDPGIRALFTEASEAKNALASFTVSHVGRERNTVADGLANEAIKRYS